MLMTAYSDIDSARKAVGIGLYDYFAKPFDVNDLAGCVKRALNHRRLVLENREYQKDLEFKVEERTKELQQMVAELEARDSLLKHMLSIQDPEVTLGLSVKLALDLCNCDAGAIYLKLGDGDFEPRAGIGFLKESDSIFGKPLRDLDLHRGITHAALKDAVENQTPVWVHDPGSVRKGFDIHSFGLLPIMRGDEVLAVLEIDRKRKDLLVGEADLEAIEGFLPYIAMSVADCKLQEQLPEWEGDVEEVLKATEEWEN